MENRKETIILTGSGHKGIVKIQSVIGTNNVKGTCNLDFRPNNAILYLIGDNIAKVKLNDINTAFEVPFCANCGLGCVVRSNSATMFGGAIQKSVAVKKIDEFNKQLSLAQSLEKVKDEKDNQRLRFEDIKTLSEWTKYDGSNFYYAIKPQLDEMFVCYPSVQSLQNALPSSKWVRIDDEDGYYVVGLIFDEDVPTFICYGVPSKKDVAPPKEIETSCVWVEVDDEQTDGYWVIYQSAINGKIK